VRCRLLSRCLTLKNIHCYDSALLWRLLVLNGDRLSLRLLRGRVRLLHLVRRRLLLLLLLLLIGLRSRVTQLGVSAVIVATTAIRLIRR
jgi:hypothetical protein